VQEKILAFHSLSEAVTVDGEPAPLAGVEAELAELRVAQAEQAATGGAKTAVSTAPEAVAVNEVCHGVDKDGVPVGEWEYLNNFFRRHNKALLDKARASFACACLSSALRAQLLHSARCKHTPRGLHFNTFARPHSSTTVHQQSQTAYRCAGGRRQGGGAPGAGDLRAILKQYILHVATPHRLTFNITVQVAVDREAARLAQENDDLRAILKQYLDGISVNEDVMANPINPLLVVNNRLQLTLRERDRARAAALQAAAVPQAAPQAVRSL
jgi:hypothetical protein